jgi:hypothetical protein
MHRAMREERQPQVLELTGPPRRGDNELVTLRGDVVVDTLEPAGLHLGDRGGIPAEMTSNSFRPRSIRTSGAVSIPTPSNLSLAQNGRQHMTGRSPVSSIGLRHCSTDQNIRLSRGPNFVTAGLTEIGSVSSLLGSPSLFNANAGKRPRAFDR